MFTCICVCIYIYIYIYMLGGLERGVEKILGEVMLCQQQTMIQTQAAHPCAHLCCALTSVRMPLAWKQLAACPALSLVCLKPLPPTCLDSKLLTFQNNSNWVKMGTILKGADRSLKECAQKHEIVWTWLNLSQNDSNRVKLGSRNPASGRPGLRPPSCPSQDLDEETKPFWASTVWASVVHRPSKTRLGSRRFRLRSPRPPASGRGGRRQDSYE